eukprot:c15901_g1_i2.p1 GENE.c15901_g1_i2~~c15901_g1_i2.p1  ORF type:complete len:344 (+),score=59.61 c15901_g1_i2:59-1090(+)
MEEYGDFEHATMTLAEVLAKPESLKTLVSTLGYAIVTGILSESELEKARAGMWDCLEYLTQDFQMPIQRGQPQTYGTFHQLLPKRSMLVQHWGIGHHQFAWSVRQHPNVAQVFSTIWDTPPEQLLTSFDAVSVALPPEAQPTQTGFFTSRTRYWMHTDQNWKKKGLQCVQGLVNLFPVRPGDSTLRVFEGSHLLHEPFFESHPAACERTGNLDWYKLTDDDLPYFDACPPRRLWGPAGSMFLWDSRTMHQGIEPLQDRSEENTRAVVYVCQTPRKWATPGDLKKKRHCFEQRRMTSHWPHQIKMFPKKPHTYGKPVGPIKSITSETFSDSELLTSLGKKLAGF